MMRTAALTVIVSVLLVANAAHAGWAVIVPELDPGSASMGLALLAGGLMVLNGRRLKR